MLKSCKYSIILGLHLLLLAHIAHTFVLLTANVEDVKKLARKFVSESLAEKIAEFIAQATEQIASNVSEENAAQEDSHQVSEENNMYNVGRQGDSGAQDALKSREDTLQEKPDDNPEIHSNSYEVTTKSEFENPDNEKEKPEFPRLEGHSRYASIEPNGVAKQYAYPLQEKKPLSKISEEDEKYEKENKQNKINIDDNFVSVQTTGAESQVSAIRPRKNKIKGRPYRLLSHVNSLEENEVADSPRKNDSIENIFGSNLFQNRAVDLTTRKAVYEFDQYENRNYPKSEFIATSGPVSLPKMPNDKWWEKKMPDLSKRLSWFK